MTKAQTISGARRSAILLLALDEDSAAEVFKYLSAGEIQQISAEMARLDQVSHEEMQQVLAEFHAETEEFIALNLNSSEHIRSVLTKALGSERASSLIEDILETSSASSGIDALNLMEAPLVAELIRDDDGRRLFEAEFPLTDLVGRDIGALRTARDITAEACRDDEDAARGARPRHRRSSPVRVHGVNLLRRGEIRKALPPARERC